MAFGDEFGPVIRESMPKTAEINIVSSVEFFEANVCWLLNNDAARPHKMSKTISIIVCREVIDDFENMPEKERYVRLLKTQEYISGKLAEFDSTNNMPRSQIPPVEKWLIGSDILLG